MHRATPNNSSHRAYSGGGSRATVDSVDDNKLMQESQCNMLSSESRGGIESAQNYGFTSHNMPKDDSGSSESFIDYCGSNRGFPRSGPIDDRRHRLRGLSEGDTAMHRGKDDAMQIHLAGDGMYHSAPQMVRVQLVPQGSGAANPPQDQAKAPQAKQSLYAKQGPYIEARLWAGLEPELQQRLQVILDRIERRRGGPSATPFAQSGGAGASSPSANGGGGGKPTGQKAVNGAGADSKEFMHVKTSESRLSHGKKVRLSTSKDDDDVLHESSSGKDYVGGTPDKHKFSKILTLAGPSKNGLARIG